MAVIPVASCGQRTTFSDFKKQKITTPTDFCYATVAKKIAFFVFEKCNVFFIAAFAEQKRPFLGCRRLCSFRFFLPLLLKPSRSPTRDHFLFICSENSNFGKKPKTRTILILAPECRVVPCDSLVALRKFRSLLSFTLSSFAPVKGEVRLIIIVPILSWNFIPALDG